MIRTSPKLPVSEHVVPPAIHYVPIVLKHGAKVEMVRADAVADVAGVKDPFVFGDRSEVEFPRSSMNREWSQIPSARRNLTVAIGIAGTCPQPASIGLLNLAPESDRQRLRWMWVFSSRHKHEIKSWPF